MLVGDTGFVMNKNLEWEDGRAFEGMRENADFWRWYLTDLTDRPRWIPPKPGTPREEPPAEPIPELRRTPAPTVPSPAGPALPDSPPAKTPIGPAAPGGGK